MAEEKLQVKTAQKPMYDLTRRSDGSTLTVEESATTITVTGSRFKAAFNKSQGTLSGYLYDGVLMLSKPLLLNVFRLPTDNDGRQTSSWDTMGLPKLGTTAKCNSSVAIHSEETMYYQK